MAETTSNTPDSKQDEACETPHGELDVYDMSIANAPLVPSYCRETAALVGKHVGEIRDAVARIRTVVRHAAAPVAATADNEGEGK